MKETQYSYTHIWECRTGIHRFLFFIGKTRIVIDQPSGLPVGVSGEAGFLRTITDFVRKKS